MGGPGLFILAYLDSSFLSFPEVTDLMIVGMVMRRPHLLPYYALMATVGSVLGCLSIYYVGGVEDCYGLAVADVDRQATDPLQVAVREGRKPGAGACDEIGLAKVVTVRLAQPLIVLAAFDSEPEQSRY